MEDLLKLRGFLSFFLEIPEEEWKAFSSLFSKKEYKKGEIFDRQGDTSRNIGFILKGGAYFSFLSEEGKELVNGFHFENDWVGSLGSLISGGPSIQSSTFLESAELLVAPYDQVKKIYERHIIWERLGRILIEMAFLEKEQREMEFLSLTAQERYDSFKARVKENITRIPKKLIASCIGIDPATLSRLS